MAIQDVSIVTLLLGDEVGWFHRVSGYKNTAVNAHTALPGEHLKSILFYF